MTPTQRSAMQAALGCLVRAEAMHGQPNAAIQEALRAALEEPVGEPVYQLRSLGDGRWIDQTKESYDYNLKHGHEVRVLYPSPPPPAEPAVEPVDIDQIAADRYKVVPSDDSMFFRWAVVAGDGKQQLYLGREAECQNMARKFAGAFLDGAYLAQRPTVETHTQPPAELPLLTDDEYTAMAHRIASRYSHRSDPQFIAYTFLPNTLEQFVRAIEQAVRRKAGLDGGAA